MQQSNATFITLVGYLLLIIDEMLSEIIQQKTQFFKSNNSLENFKAYAGMFSF